MAKVFVIIRGCRSVDDNASENPFPGLKGEMGVIPRASVLSRFPCVRDRFTRSCGTLCDAGNTIILVSEILTNAVEMEAGSVRCKTIG
jgi:hypothetical protein